MKKIIIAFIILVFLCIPEAILAMDADATSEDLLEDIMRLGNYEQIDEYAGKYLPQKLSFTELVNQIMNDNNSVGAATCRYVFDIFFYELLNMKTTIASLFSLVILFTIFNKVFINRECYISDISFMMIYAAMMAILLSSFEMIGDVVYKGIEDMLLFLSAVIPAYASTLVLTGNVSTAGAFYTFTVGLIYVLEWSIKTFIMPGIHLYVLLQILNNVYVEKNLSRMAELISRVIKLVLKFAVGIVAGMGVIQSMLNTAKDRVSDSVILKSISVIPGLGKVAGSSGEIFLSCAVLVKSTVGVAMLVLLITMTIIPLAKTYIFELTYSLLSAVVQPVADRRIVDGIHSIASAGALYVQVLICTMLLFFISTAIVCMSSSFNIT